jgi:hypothetical protein
MNIDFYLYQIERRGQVPVSTPVVARGAIRQGLSQTPLVLGTPRTPSQSQNTATPLSGRSPAAFSSIPRGDIGRGSGRAIFIPPPLRFAEPTDPDDIPTARFVILILHKKREFILLIHRSAAPEQFSESQNNSQVYYAELPGDSPLPNRGRDNERDATRRDGPTDLAAGEGQMLDAEIWGTNISVRATRACFW